MKNIFDETAEEYYNLTPNMPQKYIEMVNNIFHLRQKSKVIDLGCGSGDFALNFVRNVNEVIGLDLSNTMIKMAKEKDKSNEIEWVLNSVENYDFGINNYNLIFSYEAFHLFPNQQELIARLAKSLRKGGFIGIGWAMYEWDIPLKESIADVFAKYDIYRGEWGLWTCPNFFHDVSKSGVGFDLLEKKELCVKSKTPINQIVDYIFTNSKRITLDEELIKKIKKDLKANFLKIYPSGESKGDTKYTLMYARKE